MTTELTWTQARRIALRAQGVGGARRSSMPARRTSRAALERTLEGTHLLQIDSVSVFARAHHVPVFTRSGIWDPAVLEAAARPGPGRLVREAIAHEATYATEQVHQLLRFRRRAAAQQDWAAIRGAADSSQQLFAQILQVLAELGPASAAQVSRYLGDTHRGEGWGWRRTASQWAVEYLFRSGALDCVGRSAKFERLYVRADDAPDLHELIPGQSAGGRAASTDGGPPAEDEHAAIRGLVSLAAEALGVADAAALADYFRLPVRRLRPAIEDLRACGELTEVTVRHAGGARPLLLHRTAPAPRALRTAALVSPFDPIVFYRPRLQTLFDVEYRIGIYTPQRERTTGYYSLLFLLGDLFPARIDLKSRREHGVLEVCGVYREALEHLPQRLRPTDDTVAAALAGELRRAADWQGLPEVEVRTGPGTGEYSEALARALHESADGPDPK